MAPLVKVKCFRCGGEFLLPADDPDVASPSPGLICESCEWEEHERLQAEEDEEYGREESDNDDCDVY